MPGTGCSSRYSKCLTELCACECSQAIAVSSLVVAVRVALRKRMLCMPHRWSNGSVWCGDSCMHCSQLIVLVAAERLRITRNGHSAPSHSASFGSQIQIDFPHMTTRGLGYTPAASPPTQSPRERGDQKALCRYITTATCCHQKWIGDRDTLAYTMFTYHRFTV